MILDEIEWPGESFDLIDATLARLHRDGLECRALLVDMDSLLAMVHVAEVQGSVIHASQLRPEGAVALGVSVTGYKHPATGEIVEVLCLRFMPERHIVFSD